MAFSVAFTVGPWLGTFIMEKFGSDVMWVFMLLIGSISSLMLMKIKNVQPKLSHV
jgi:uncharacterized membrane protein YoaK (UPF0700 family)